MRNVVYNRKSYALNEIGNNEIFKILIVFSLVSVKRNYPDH